MDTRSRRNRNIETKTKKDGRYRSLVKDFTERKSTALLQDVDFGQHA